MVKLRNWTLTAGGDEYSAPECRPLCAGGEIDSHPRFSVGGRVVTSAIRFARGNVIKTENTTYQLVGPPCDHFVESVLHKHGLMFNGDIGPIVEYLS